MTGRLSKIWIHPIKACCRVAIPAATVLPGGLEGDRRWIITDADGQFITQRDCPDLVHVQPGPAESGWDVSWRGEDSVFLPSAAEGPWTRVRIWKDTVEGRLGPQQVSDWLSARIGRPVQVVFVPEDRLRPVDANFGKPGDRVGFADGYPLLLASTESLADLNARMADPVPMNRFRPNVVVDGFEPFDEDRWTAVQIGSVRFDVVKPCERCQVINTDQESGRFDRTPLRTLASFRTSDGKVHFGENLIPRGPGILRIGDTVVPIRE